ncbi:uncharacterized protein LOC110099513 [Dendrobium catenatum]|uniref:uncharacterized protein LOC110099513 n=1 Tax=Dendrobium catenatum TaxID=906689 RepID=UPI00109F811B|nr:uncharacterized protein LOC110099513 [Dendrobium catenatum]
MALKEYAELQRQVELIANGQVWPSARPCTLPVLLVPKKNGFWRMCIGSSTVNKVIDAYALVGDITGFAEKIQSFFMQELLSETYTLLKDIVIEEHRLNVPKYWSSP